jgi:hypothetical protein
MKVTRVKTWSDGHDTVTIDRINKVIVVTVNLDFVRGYGMDNEAWAKRATSIARNVMHSHWMKVTRNSEWVNHVPLEFESHSSIYTFAISPKQVRDAKAMDVGHFLYQRKSDKERAKKTAQIRKGMLQSVRNSLKEIMQRQPRLTPEHMHQSIHPEYDIEAA